MDRSSDPPAPVAEAAPAGFTVAETACGRVQGLVVSGIHQFKNLPYGAPTGGANRFMPPRPPAPWTGVRACLGYGPVSPQVPTDLANDYGALLQLDLGVATGGMGEDCLHLNIWTPGVGDGGRRPVLVSLHGGGFAIGSGNGAIYDGAQLARLGDVVVVTVTHRLGSFGFINLIDAGAPPEFAHAGAAGIMDLVAALEWVRDNISGFGGDPGRVMIFGQSGGGWKVSTLLAAPAARGLFHRAAIQSGSLLAHATREQTAPPAEAFLARLGLSRATAAEIQSLPWERLLSAQTALGAQVFAPVLDGDWLPWHPGEPAGLEISASIPVLISTTLDDAGLFFTLFDLDEPGLEALLRQRWGDKGPEMLALYRRLWPAKSPYLLWSQIVTDSGFRRYAHAQAEAMSARGGAPVHAYLWEHPSPSFDGRYGAVHAMDVSASFNNPRDAILGGGSAEARAMCRQLASAWVAFARAGDPNTPALPAWPAFDATRRATLVLGPDTRVVDDPYPEIRAFWRRMPAPLSVLG